jgi:hypothetical protein
MGVKSGGSDLKSFPSAVTLNNALWQVDFNRDLLDRKYGVVIASRECTPVITGDFDS